jgi:hypothetical protein
MDQVSIKYTNIFQCKTFQNLPKFAFSVWKQTIWQPCSEGLGGSDLPVKIKTNFGALVDDSAIRKQHSTKEKKKIQQFSLPSPTIYQFLLSVQNYFLVKGSPTNFRY